MIAKGGGLKNLYTRGKITPPPQSETFCEHDPKSREYDFSHPCKNRRVWFLELGVWKYKEAEYGQAFQEYERLEQQSRPNRQTVLVAVNQIKKLRDAYPNYFMNLSSFLDIITFILAKNNKKS